jgi:hypothetical protein
MSIGWVYPIGIMLSYILILIEYFLRKNFDMYLPDYSEFPSVSIILVALLFLTLGVIQWFRYRNRIYPILGILMSLTIGQVSLIFPDYDDPGILTFTYFASLLTIVLVIIVNWKAIYSHERFEINSRRLFRLASERIISTDDGFTTRPYTGTRVECTREGLMGLSRYLEANYIVRPFYHDTMISFAFSMNKSLVVIDDAKEVSNVTISFDGNITVSISDKDYRDYRQHLSFDRLCQALSDVFRRFIDYYSKGLESRIMAELKSAR